MRGPRYPVTGPNRRPLLPVVRRGANLLRRPRDEVPPHQHRLGERRSAEEQHTPAFATAQGDVGVSRLEGVHRVRLDALDFAAQKKEAVLECRIERELECVVNLDVEADEIREPRRGRRSADDDVRMSAFQLDPRHFRHVMKRGFDVAMFVRQCDPELHTVEPAAVRGRSRLRMRDAAARRHHVHAARSHHRLDAEAVLMEDFAVEEPGNGLDADVRMRRDVHRRAGRKRERPVAVEKAPRADQSSLAHRKRAPDLELSKMRGARGMRLHFINVLATYARRARATSARRRESSRSSSSKPAPRSRRPPRDPTPTRVGR